MSVKIKLVKAMNITLKLTKQDIAEMVREVVSTKMLTFRNTTNFSVKEVRVVEETSYLDKVLGDGAYVVLELEEQEIQQPDKTENKTYSFIPPPRGA